jgi:D-3-phosphoglycerate dehydrogenase
MNQEKTPKVIKEDLVIDKNMKIKIAITTGSFAEFDTSPVELLYKNGFKAVRNSCSRKLNKKETLLLCKNCIGIVAGTETYDSYVLTRLPRVKIISRCGTGIDNIDLDAAKRLGIKIFNTPEPPVQAVAELTVGLMLNLLRKINQMHNAVKGNNWERQMGNLLRGKKIGIIGFGRIGKKVAELLKIFDCEIAYTDPLLVKSLKSMPLEELLAWADIISIHVSGKNRILGKQEFQAMKEGAWIINTSRGGVIDENELYKMLVGGRLSGAAIDVFAREPYSGPLKNLSNTILTPHIGSYAREARIKMENQAVKNLLKGLEV